MREFDSIIFDVDGTLWDSTGTLAKAYSAASEEFCDCFGLQKRSFSKEQIMGELGQPTIEIFHHLYPELEGFCPDLFLKTFRRAVKGEAPFTPMLSEQMQKRKEPLSFAGVAGIGCAEETGSAGSIATPALAADDIETVYEFMVWRSMEFEYDFLRKYGAEVYPAVTETLRALKEKYRLFIVSNCEKGYIELFTGFSETAELFEGWLSYGDTGVEKDTRPLKRYANTGSAQITTADFLLFL